MVGVMTPFCYRGGGPAGDHVSIDIKEPKVVYTIGDRMIWAKTSED